jgi:hypothetical protein
MKFAASANVLSYMTLNAFQRSVLRLTHLVVLLAGMTLALTANSFAQDDSVPEMDFGPEVGSNAEGQAPATPPAGGAAPSAQGNAPNDAQAPQFNAPAAAQQQPAAQKQSPDVAGAQLEPFFRVAALTDVVGEPLPLERLLHGAYSPADRLRRLDAYWDLSGKHALVVLSALNHSYINKCIAQLLDKHSDNLPPAVYALAVSTQSGAKQKYDAARLDFLQAQYDFDAAFSTPAGRRAAMNRAQGAPNKTTRFFGSEVVALYIPSATPATGVYKTNYEEMARQRKMSAEATKLNVLLPLLYDTLQTRATQAAAEKALFEAEFQSQSATAVSLFAAADRYFNAQKGAIAAAIKYNCAIAAYSCETVQGSLQGDRLLGTLNQLPSAQAQTGAPQQTPPPAQNAPQPANRVTYCPLVLPGLDYLEPAREAFADAYYRTDYANALLRRLILDGAETPLVENVLAQADPLSALTSDSSSILDEPIPEDVNLESLVAQVELLPDSPSVLDDSIPEDANLENLAAQIELLPTLLSDSPSVLDEPIPEDSEAGMALASFTADSTTKILPVSYTINKPIETADQEAAKKAAEEEAARVASEEQAKKEAEAEAARIAAEEQAKKAAEAEAARVAAEEQAKKEAEAEAARVAAEEQAKKEAEAEAARVAAEEQAKKAAEEEAAKEAAENEMNSPEISQAAPSAPSVATAAVQPNVAESAEPHQDGSLPIIITGYEQFEAPLYIPTPVVPAPPVGDGAYWCPFDDELDKFYADMYEESRGENVDGDAEPSETMIVRAQQQEFDSYAPSGTQNSLPSYETAQRNAANAEAANAEQTEIYQRVQRVVEIYFAPVQPKTDDRTGVSERGLSLANAFSRVPGVPYVRHNVAKTYWELQGAVATLRIETLALQQYTAALKSAPNDQFVSTQALGAQARMVAAQTKVRETQIKLLRMMNISPGYGYPVPTTVPFCGKNFDLGSPRTFNANMRRSSGLIPERLKTAQDLSAKLGSPDVMLKLELDSDPQTAIATLEKNRELILAYIQLIVDLNASIAEYVAYFPANVSNEQFVKALSGKDM